MANRSGNSASARRARMEATASYIGAGVVGGGGVVPPVLKALTVSPSSATVGQAYTGAVSGRTVGSGLALSGAGAAGLVISSTTGIITGTPTTSGAVNVVETLAGATGSPKTSAGVVTVSASGLSLPTAPFGATNGRLWLDTRQTSFIMTDNTGGITTVGAIEDLFGNSRGFANGDKSTQPKLGPNGGILFDADGQTLSSFIRNVVNGLSFVSIYAAFRLDSASYGAGSKRRAIIAITEAATTATPPGSGSSQERLAANLSGGTGGRKPFSTVSIMDGTGVVTSTTSPAIPSLASDTKVHAGWEYDLSQTVASQSIYENGALVGTVTWTPTETDKKLNTADAVAVTLGQRATSTGVNSGTLFGELFALVVLGEIPDAVRRAQIHTYLNGVIA